MNNNIIGISRIRNVDFIIKDVLDHLSSYLKGVVIYDDSSTDDTLKILKEHELVLEIIENKEWESNKYEREKAEGYHRQELYDKAKKYNPDWIYVFDADEFIEFDDNINLKNNEVDAYFFRLFDYYITPDDKSLKYNKRKFIGPEYRDIPMLFNAELNLTFKTRVPLGFEKVKFGGYVKHYGKAISIEEWENKCNYYISHLNEQQPGYATISEKWRNRLGKAIHTTSDFNNPLITWEQKQDFGVQLLPGMEKLSMLNLKILVATNSLKSLGGSETFTYTIIEELKKYPNLIVEYFTFEKGVVSEKIEKELNVKFSSKKKYDLILANHYNCVNYLHKKGFVIQTCHGVYPSLERPNIHAKGYVAISQEVQGSLINKGYPSKLIYNSINLTRFYSKRHLNQSPKVVLSLCHSEDANKKIKRLCDDLNLEYLEAYKFDNPVWSVENIINKADVVFALGRSAYESIACGRPVIVYDERAYFPSYGDGYLKSILGLSLQNNCSGRYFKQYLTLDDLKDELKRYNSKDGEYFRHFAQKELDVRINVVRYIEYFFQLQKIKKSNSWYKNQIEYLKQFLIREGLIDTPLIKMIKKYMK